MSCLEERAVPKHLEMEDTALKEEVTVTTENCDAHLNDTDSPYLAKNNFLCDECGKSFTTENCLSVHLNAHKFADHKSLHKCDICNEMFQGKASLAIHRRFHQKQFRCGECGDWFTKKMNLDGHKLIHEGRQPYKCDTCGEEFRFKSLLIYHTRDHTGEKLFECNICGLKVKTKGTLKMHLVLHTGGRNFKCDICLKTFRFRRHLVAHIKTHTKLMPVTCEICNASFASKQSLKVHMTRHFETKKFRCELCLQGFDRRYKLVNHKEYHIAANEWKCLECGTIFEDNASLISHEEKSHKTSQKKLVSQNSIPNVCYLCGQHVTTKKRLKEHRKMHIAKDSWKCLTCDEFFSSRTLLFTHRKKSHRWKCRNDKFSYKCEYCEKNFSTKGNLNIHNRFHVGQNKWKCLRCGKIFSDFDTLHFHGKTNHLIKHHKDTIHYKGYYTRKKHHKDTIHHKGHYTQKKRKINLSNKGRLYKQHMKKNKVNTDQNGRKGLYCKTCGFRVANGYHMRSHCLLFHLNRSPAYLCTQCGKHFSTRRALKTHSVTCKCKAALKNKCSKCYLVFNSRIHLLLHNRTHEDSLHYKCNSFRKNLFFESEFLNANEKCFFQCHICFAKFTHKTFLKYHVQMHNKNIKCEICGTDFRSIHSLLLHKKSHVFRKQMRCSYCFKLFNHRVCYEYHLKCHKLKKKKHRCKLCKTRFEAKSEMLEHMKIKSFKCRFCQKRFHARKSLRAHRMVHISKYIWKCNDCKNIFPDKRALIIHYNINHGILGKRKRKTLQNECSKCGQIDAHKEICMARFVHKNCKCSKCLQQKPPLTLCLKKDIRLNNSKDSQNKNYIEFNTDESQKACCTGCGTTFKFMISLQEHNRKWHCKFSCFHCKLEFTGSKNYKNHMKTHEFKCGICKVSIKKYSHLEKHLMIHEVYHKCKICGQLFDEINRYKNHILGHEEHPDLFQYHEILKVNCEYCLLDFKSKVDLEEHMQVSHTSIHRVHNLYFCQNCGASFITFMELQTHSQTCKYLTKCKHFKTEFSSYKQWKDVRDLFASERALTFCGSCRIWINYKSVEDYCLLIEKSLRPHECKVCNRYFLQKSRLKEHCLTRHSQNVNQLSNSGSDNLSSSKGMNYHLNSINDITLCVTEEHAHGLQHQKAEDSMIEHINCATSTLESTIASTKCTNENIHFPKQLLESSITKDCDISVNQYINAPASHSDSCLKRNAGELLSNPLTVESDINASSNVDLCSSAIVSHTQNQIFEYPDIKREQNAIYDLENIKPDPLPNSDNVSETTNVKQEKVTLITGLENYYAQQKCNEIKGKHDLHNSDNVTKSFVVKQEVLTPSFGLLDGTCNERNVKPPQCDKDVARESICVKKEVLVQFIDTAEEGRSARHNQSQQHQNDLDEVKDIIDFKQENLLDPFISKAEDSRFMNKKSSNTWLKTENEFSDKTLGSGSKMPYRCDICQGIFPDRLSEYVHKRIHIGSDFLFECKSCSLKFSLMDEWVRHQSVHRNRKAPQFYCCFCDEKFSDEALCKYHIKFRLCLVT